MAFPSILRRGSASFLPLTIRSVAARRSFLGAISARGPVARRFSTAVSAKPAADVNLVCVLESQIECAEQPAEVEDIPEGFPFQIQDTPGERIINLERKYRNEIIKVEVELNYSWRRYHSSGRDDEDDIPSLRLFVSVSKGDGQCLKFQAIAYPDEISICSLSFRNSEHSKDQLFDNDLGEYSWKVFHKYLEIRGINLSMMKFLFKYINIKHHREYMMMLKNIKGFVEK